MLILPSTSAAPPTIVEGVRVSDEIPGGWIVSAADFVTEL